jgi:NADH dehydrogenase
MVQISAIGADKNSASAYARSKAEGEELALAAVPYAVIMRPSIIFGPEDTFFNRFASMARTLPALPLIGGGLTRLQPVFAGDVATAIADAVDGKAKPGAIYELGGPDILTFRQLMQFTLDTIERRRALVALPFPIANLMASVLQFVPGAPLTPDQVEMLRTDNVVSDDAKRAGRTLDAFGVAPDSIAAIVPTYLWRFRKTGQFSSSHA